MNDITAIILTFNEENFTKNEFFKKLELFLEENSK